MPLSPIPTAVSLEIRKQWNVDCDRPNQLEKMCSDECGASFACGCVESAGEDVHRGM